MNLRAHTKFTIGIEDTPQFHYQTAIFAESLAQFLPPGAEIYVVVCNDGRPLSNDLAKIFDVYQDKVKYFSGRQLSRIPCDAHSGDCNAAMNKIEALNVVGDHCEETDLVVLTDADIFLYKQFDANCIPRKNTLSANSICAAKPFWTPNDSKIGVDLDVLLRALGCETGIEAGGVSIFLEGSTAKNRKFRDDCIRFCQLLFLAANIVEVGKRAWMSEMVCYAMSLSFNQIDYEVVDIPEFTTANVDDQAIREGSFYHYFVDLRDNNFRRGAFPGSLWHKHDYLFSNLLNDNLEYFLSQSATDHEKYFFETAIAARDRLMSERPGFQLTARLDGHTV